MTTVVFSLDTELAWGRLSSDKQGPLYADPTAGREAMEFVLDTFNKYSIPATWAIVGHLLLEECDRESHYVADHVGSVDPFTDVDTDPLYYCPTLVEEIADDPVGHEIAGHSFSHPRFGELSRSEALDELEAMCDVFRSNGHEISTLVHPGIDNAHVDLLPEFGIDTYSGACHFGNCTLKGGLVKLLQRDPAILSAPLVEPSVDVHGSTVIPRSRSLRDERWGWLNPRRVRDALAGATEGDGRVLHLTFHPHNVIYDQFLRRTLPAVLEVVDRHRTAGTVEVKPMRAVSASFDSTTRV